MNRVIELNLYGQVRGVCAELLRYSSGGALALRLVCAEEGHLEPFATVSCNLDVFPAEVCIWLKDWSENEAIAQQLLAKGLLRPTGRTATMGHCDAKECRVTPALRDIAFLEGYETDAMLAALTPEVTPEVTTEVPASHVITEWVQSGQLDECGSTEEVLEQAGRLLDRSCSHEICGEVLFKAADGKYYVGTVEFMIQEANPEYVRDTLVEAGLRCRIDGCENAIDDGEGWDGMCGDCADKAEKDNGD